MRTLVHLSDLHFGSVDPALIDPLIRSVSDLRPDLVVVSGDLTQRARSHQFKEARAFLDALPHPQIVVPGNHDVPLYNLFARFLQPLENYRRYVTDELEPFFRDGEIAVIGVNTARSLTIKGGRISSEQVVSIRQKLCAIGEEVVKVVVSHHPFDVPEGRDDDEIAGRAEMAITGLAECGADLFLAGHLHVGYSDRTGERYKMRGHSALVVQAGTASSTRERGEENSFNVISVSNPDITVTKFTWQFAKAAFVPSTPECYRHGSEGWVRT